MPFFKYRVCDQQGKSASGSVEASSEKDAARLLRDQGLLITELVAVGGLNLQSLNFSFQNVSFGDIVNFTRQLSTMITAGLTLTDSLSLLRNQTENKVFSNVISDVLHEVESGSNFADSLSKYPQHFSKIYTSLIRAGEAGGMMDQVLGRLADNLEKEREFRGKIKGVMIYPSIIMAGMFIVGFLMMTMVVPKLTALYKDFGITLPLATRILIFISDFFVKFWWLIIAVVFGLITAFKGWRKTPVGTRMWDSLMLKVPVWGALQKEILLVEFTRTLGMLVGAGLPLIEALNIVADSLDNVIYEEGIKEAAQKVEKGFPLGVPISQNQNFPPILGQMVKVGEETGKLDESLLKLSHYFESESDQLVRGLTSAIEPIIMLVLGLGVGFLVFSIIMPIYKITEAF